jgi:hypothetical protein
VAAVAAASMAARQRMNRKPADSMALRPTLCSVAACASHNSGMACVFIQQQSSMRSEFFDVAVPLRR